MNNPRAPEIPAEWLATLEAFAETRNLTRAGRLRGLSQPAVHAQLRRLAELVGAELYAREGRGLVLTAAGREVAAFAADARGRAAALVESLGGAGAARRVTLAAGTGTFVHLLAPALERALGPGRGAGAKLERVPVLRTLVRDAVLAAVAAGEADLGVTADVDEAAAADARVVLEPLTRVEVVAIARADGALAARRSGAVTLERLAREPWVAPPAGGPQRAALDAAFRARGEPPRVAVEAGSWELAITLVRLGLGFAIVNGFCRLPKGVVARRVPALPPVRYVVARPAGPAPTGDAGRLLEAIRACADAWREAPGAAVRSARRGGPARAAPAA